VILLRAVRACMTGDLWRSGHLFETTFLPAARARAARARHEAPQYIRRLAFAAETSNDCPQMMHQRF